MKATTIGVDLAKSVFQLAISTEAGKISQQRRLSRAQFERFLAQSEPARIVMEACGSAHYWGRQARAHGHEPMLLPPHAVRPYVRGNKTDAADAKALLEAVRNEEIPPVPIKTLDQHALAGLHRLRTAWRDTRTARINGLRGLLREIGLTFPAGAREVAAHVDAFLCDADSAVPEAIRPLLFEATQEIRELERRIAQAEAQLEAISRQDALATRLRSIPGVGLLTATAFAGFVGDLSRFRSGRQLASYLGLTPRESSSGLRRRLGSISKRGDAYLRTLLVHGARSVLLHSKRMAKLDRLRAWALDRERAKGHNKAAIALANKLARVIWAVGSRELTYTSTPAPSLEG